MNILTQTHCKLSTRMQARKHISIHSLNLKINQVLSIILYAT
jgi:hypothetical protein